MFSTSLTREDDRQNKIYEKLQNAYNLLCEKYEIFGVFLKGSQNYNLDNEDSDIDLVAVIIPSAEDLIFDCNKNYGQITITNENNKKEFVEIFTIQKVAKLLLKQNINILELFSTNYRIVPDKHYNFYIHNVCILNKIVQCAPESLIACVKGLSYSYLKTFKKAITNTDQKKAIVGIRRCLYFLNSIFIGHTPVGASFKAKGRYQEENLNLLNKNLFYYFDELNRQAKETIENIEILETFVKQKTRLRGIEIRENDKKFLDEVKQGYVNYITKNLK